MSFKITHLRLQLHLTGANMLSVAEAEIEGLVQECSNSIANALELLQSCIKTLKWPSLQLCLMNVATSSQNVWS